MKRVGIITIHDTNNLGNRLQNYALARTISGLGHEPWSIPNVPFPGEPFRRPAQVAASQDGSLDDRGPLARGLEKVWRRGWQAVSSADLPAVADGVFRLGRQGALARFTRRHIPTHDHWVTAPEHLEPLDESFDAFIVGSDQVWNPDYRGGCPLDFVRFAPRHKRISYAASFGKRSLSDRYAGGMGRWIRDFAHVSVRERTGQEIVNEVADRDAHLVLDPTLLVPRETWSALADRAPRASRRPYLAHYLLKERTQENLAAVSELADDAGLAMVDMLRPRSLRPSRHGVEGFLRTLREARLVVTDSFHASVFSSLFGTRFVSLRRTDLRDDRVDTLLTTVGLDPDQGRSMPTAWPPQDALSPNGDKVDATLSGPRERSLDFLRTALES